VTRPAKLGPIVTWSVQLPARENVTSQCGPGHLLGLDPLTDEV
jgi:hypothetical protein